MMVEGEVVSFSLLVRQLGVERGGERGLQFYA